MSMLSSKCDSLRDRAHELRMFADGLSAPYIVPSTKETMGLSMQSAATELERAADVIWDLHCKCSDLMGEREELSSRLEHATEMNSMLIGMPEHDRMQIASMLTSIDGINLQSTIRELEAENAKLQDENARLRSCLSDDAENARQIMGENARMRELIQKAWKWEKNGCYECPLERDCKADSVYDGDCGMAVEIEEQMRELRIEVE